MFSQQMKTKIESLSFEMMERNPFFSKVRQGALTENELGSYLYNLMQVLGHGHSCLLRAASVSEQRGNATLARFFEHKAAEEKGHEEWAKQDLNSRSLSPGQFKLTEAFENIISYFQSIIETNPAFYVCYVSFVEYFTVLVAPQFLANLEERCDVPRSHMTAVSHHEELDKEHIRDDLAILDELFSDSAEHSALLQVVDRTAALVSSALASCVRMS